MKGAFLRLWKKYRSAFFLALAVLYLPHAWNALVTGWGDFSDGNIGIFLVQPGCFLLVLPELAGLKLLSRTGSPTIALTLMGLTSAGLIAALTIVGAKSRRWQIAAIVAGGIYSVAAAILFAALDLQGSV